MSAKIEAKAACDFFIQMNETITKTSEMVAAIVKSAAAEAFMRGFNAGFDAAKKEIGSKGASNDAKGVSTSEGSTRSVDSEYSLLGSLQFGDGIGSSVVIPHDPYALKVCGWCKGTGFQRPGLRCPRGCETPNA